MTTGVNKVNNELQQIVAGTLDDTYRKRLEWSNARGARLKFIEELREAGITGKEYSDRVVAYDRDAMYMSWHKGGK